MVRTWHAWLHAHALWPQATKFNIVETHFNFIIVNTLTIKKMLLFEFIQLIAKEEQSVDFLIQHNVLINNHGQSLHEI